MRVLFSCAIFALMLGACGGGADDVEVAEAEPTEVEVADDASSDSDSDDGTIPCAEAGPQSGRDIDLHAGTNENVFPLAPAPETMNLCNLHFHRYAEHKAAAYPTLTGSGDHEGYACLDAPATPADGDYSYGDGGCKDIAPGQTIEVHWVYTTCDTGPGVGLGNCVSCDDPDRRVRAEARIFTLGSEGADFADFDYLPGSDPSQPKALPPAIDPVLYRGSTTGTSFDDQRCSPFEVTFNVGATCSPLDIDSVHRWCGNPSGSGNIFEEDGADGTRPLVTELALLSKIGA